MLLHLVIALLFFVGVPIVLQLVHDLAAQVGGGVGHRAYHVVQVLPLQVGAGKAVAEAQKQPQQQHRYGHPKGADQQQEQDEHRQGGDGLVVPPDLQLVVDEPAAQGGKEPLTAALPLAPGRLGGRSPAPPRCVPSPSPSRWPGPNRPPANPSPYFPVSHFQKSSTL